MKYPFALLILANFAAAHAQAYSPSGASSPLYSQPGQATAVHNGPLDRGSHVNEAKAPAGTPKVDLSITSGEKGKAASTFPSNTPKLLAVFRTHGTQKGDKIQVVWLSQVGGSKKKLNQSSLTGDQSDFVGSFTLGGPATGWPPGKYKVELYLGNKLAASANFTMVKKGG